MKGSKLPKTDSIQELAQFWDTHDLTHFDGELEEVGEPIFESETIVEVHLQPEEAEAIKKVAESKGLGDADLIREWVLEKLEFS